MIYVTGDTHGYIDFDKLQRFAEENKQLTRRDYVIIAGDFGGVWYRKTLEEDLKYYKELPFTVLFVDGNHENFDLLNEFPVEEWNGGKVHIVAENIIHLMRGQVFNIEGKTFFTFGGATSTDKYMRVPGKEWWPQEVPSDADIVEANKNLERVGFKVDYIITHEPPASLKDCLRVDTMQRLEIHAFFEDLTQDCQFKQWYFGKCHLNRYVPVRYFAVFDDIIPLKDTGGRGEA